MTPGLLVHNRFRAIRGVPQSRLEPSYSCDFCPNFTRKLVWEEDKCHDLRIEGITPEEPLFHRNSQADNWRRQKYEHKEGSVKSEIQTTFHCRSDTAVTVEDQLSSTTILASALVTVELLTGIAHTTRYGAC